MLLRLISSCSAASLTVSATFRPLSCVSGSFSVGSEVISGVRMSGWLLNCLGGSSSSSDSSSRYLPLEISSILSFPGYITIQNVCGFGPLSIAMAEAVPGTVLQQWLPCIPVRHSEAVVDQGSAFYQLSDERSAASPLRGAPPALAGAFTL